MKNDLNNKEMIFNYSRSDTPPNPLSRGGIINFHTPNPLSRGGIINFLSSVGIICIFILFLFSTAYSQNSPILKNGELPDLKINNSTSYYGNDLFSFNDGGADIYLEYGFKQLTVQEITSNNIKFTIETYEMDDVDAAFGIFSVNKGKCNKRDFLNLQSWVYCVSPNQTHFADSVFYIRILNESGSDDAVEISKSLANEIIKKISPKFHVIPYEFKKDLVNNRKNEYKLIKGKLGLQNGMPEWLRYFDKFKKYKILLLKINSLTDPVNSAKIEFQNEDSFNQFFKLFDLKSFGTKKIYKVKIEDKYIEIKQIGPTLILFLETKYYKPEN